MGSGYVKFAHMTCVIYGLFDPITTQLRYVGKTAGPLERRLRGHINDVKRGRVYIPRHRWIAGLIAGGVEPIICEIEEVAGDWREAEQFWIAYFRSIGCNLLNATDGGDGICSYQHSEATKQKQSESARARYRRAGEREKSGAAVAAAYADPVVRAKIQGRAVSNETREKLSIAMKIVKGAPEVRAAMSARLKGRMFSEETRRAISAANKGRKMSPEFRANQAARRLGKKHSAATIEKMRATAARKRIERTGS